MVFGLTRGAAILSVVLLAMLLTQSVGAHPAQVAWPELTLREVASGFNFPVHIAAPHDGSGRLFVVEKAGRILIVENGQRVATPFLDIRDEVNSACNECGLLSVAFPPDYAENGYFFVYYNAKADLFPELERQGSTQDSVVARFRVSDDPGRADPTSAEFILTQMQPFVNHNGGQIAFAPDGTLFIGLGDGGGGGDPLGAGQDMTTWLGKLLRIQVGATGPYSVPADNPFVDDANVRPEIWASGLRNPYRFAFGPDATLYIGDVGQNSYEEINVALGDGASGFTPGGANYGWNIMEGNVCYPALDTNCDTTGLTAPVAVYGHGLDCSVTGGMVFVTAGHAPVYLYGDWCSGRIRGLQRLENPTRWADTLLLDTAFQISSFGSDEAGTVYVVDAGGAVYRVEASIPTFLPWLSALTSQS